MADYSALDHLILSRCKHRGVTFMEMRVNEEIHDEAVAVAKPDRYGVRYGFRVIDRRLQALRKAGKLTYNRTDGWRAA